MRCKNSIEETMILNAGSIGVSIRYSVGGYHRSLSRSKPGFESLYRKLFKCFLLLLFMLQRSPHAHS
jgi:hypothetical protein